MKNTTLLRRLGSGLLACASLCGFAAAGPIAADGVTEEWAEGVHAAVDAEYVYFRLPFGELRSLMTEGRPVTIRFDVDDSERTGVPVGGPSGRLGVDFEVMLRRAESWRGPSFFAKAYGPRGNATTLEFEAVEPLMMPRSAAEEFELRLRRDATPLLLGELDGRGEIELTNGRRVRDGREWRFETITVPFELSAAAGRAVRPVEAVIPPKPEGAVRFVAHNVLWQNPEDEGPEPFARMYRALDPDVYLIQEWGQERWSAGYDERLRAWFERNLPDVGPDVGPEVGGERREWSAVRSNGWGVAIVTPHEIAWTGDRDVRAETLTRWDFPVRVKTAVIDTPNGLVAAGSIHLKAGGALDTPEDQRRMDEMRAVGLEMRAARAEALSLGKRSGEPVMVVLGGDYNHNGHPRVVETGLAGLDLDGSPLELAFTPVLGTTARYSFGGPAYGHRRSFLDYIAFSDANVEVVNAFVLDTEILSDSSLSGMGLRRSDTSAADHLPVVVDLKFR